MSNLLERAIVDAKALREAALKNAEQLVVEKYSLEVKEAMSRLLEQEEENLDEQDLGAATDPMTDLFGDAAPAADAEQPEDTGLEDDAISVDDLEAQLPDAFMADDDEVIQIKLDSLDDELEDEEGVFGGDDELADDEIAIDIEDDEEMDPEMDVDLDSELDMGGDIGIDVAGIDATALEEIIGDALRDILSEEEEEELSIRQRNLKVPATFPSDDPDTTFDEWEAGMSLPDRGIPGLDAEEEAGMSLPPKKLPLGSKASKRKDVDEEIDLDELMERVRVDLDPQKSGWAGTPESIMQEYEAMLLAREQDSDVKEKNAELRKNVAALQKENKTLSSAAMKLQEQNKNFNATFEALQEKLETMNVSNAKLLYINQALENASLNERQRRKLVEAISKAETVQEAKIVFDTMSDTVTTTSDVKKDATLNEMVSRKSSLLVAARKEQPKQDANPLFNRMQTLAGIKTK